jgi:pantothenate kinase
MIRRRRNGKPETFEMVNLVQFLKRARDQTKNAILPC